MKKIIFIFTIILLQLMNCSAETLNFRTNTLMSFEYSINDEKNHFKMFTNNQTGHLIYSISPLEEPKYQTDYLYASDIFTNIDKGTQNKIKSYIWETEKEPEYANQMMYYMNTQLLIWKTFHPELIIKIEQEYLSLEEYENKMKEKFNQTPFWIKNYEIEEKLELPKEEHYRITSNDCKISEENGNWSITDCKENSKIEVIEEQEENMKVYALNNTPTLIETGFSKRSWSFSIKKISKEIPPENQTTQDTPEKPELDNNKEEENKFDSSINESEKEENKKEENTQNKPIDTKANNRETIKIDQVPNTLENQSIGLVWIELLLLCVVKKYL